MQVGMLIEGRMLPIPEGIKLVKSFGAETVISPEKEGITGIAAIIEGDAEDIQSWLRPYDGFYKPHPWHLFNIFKQFFINPKMSFYIGYEDIDEKFARHAGIENYIDCSIPKNINDIMEYSHAQTTKSYARV